MSDFSKLSEKVSQNLTAILFVAAAFVIGMLVTEVRYLKQGAPTSAPVVGDPSAQLPAGPSEPIEEWDSQRLAAVPAVSSDDYIRGNVDAAITLIEYSDFDCPFCQRFAETLGTILNEYPDTVRVVYRHYPLKAIHPNATRIAEASECVGSLGGNDAFWDFHDGYFARTAVTGSTLPDDQVEEIVATTGVSVGAFQECWASGEFTAKVDAQLDSGASLGIQGTPGTIVLTNDGRGGLISGALPLEAIREIVGRYL